MMEEKGDPNYRPALFFMIIRQDLYMNAREIKSKSIDYFEYSINELSDQTKIMFDEKAKTNTTWANLKDEAMESNYMESS